MACIASARSSASINAFDQPAKSSRSSGGTPSSSQMTSTGHQERVLGEQVHPAGGRQRVDQLVGDLPDPRSQLLHPAHGEGARDELAQPGVLRRVHLQHHRERLRGRGGALLGRQGVALVLRQPRVGQRGPDVGVAADQPAGSVTEVDLADGLVRAQRAVGGVRVVPEVAVEQRRAMRSPVSSSRCKQQLTCEREIDPGRTERDPAGCRPAGAGRSAPPLRTPRAPARSRCRSRPAPRRTRIPAPPATPPRPAAGPPRTTAARPSSCAPTAGRAW